MDGWDKWKERFVDARFSAAEATAWELLRADGLSPNEATAELLRIRQAEAERKP